MAATFKYNHNLYSFSDGTTTFTVTAGQVYVLEGPASGPEAINRIERLPYGGIHDLDGTSDGATYPPLVTWRLLFKAASPFAQAQYINLQKLINHHGTLTMKVPSTASTETQTAPARLVNVDATWRPPYKLALTNHLFLSATWQLKDYPQT